MGNWELLAGVEYVVTVGKVPVPMDHSWRRLALYLLSPCGVTRIASSNAELRVGILSNVGEESRRERLGRD